MQEECRDMKRRVPRTILLGIIIWDLNRGGRSEKETERNGKR